jgi:hypothetical protein
LTIKTSQPNSSSGRTYQVDYEILVPSSWEVTLSDVNGSVSVTNLPIVFSTNSRTSVSGIAGAGKGTIKLSSVNGVIQVLGF